jgi:predicted metal-binding membrane protein
VAAGTPPAWPWLLAGLVGTAWLSLWLWGVSPYAHLLGHHRGAGSHDGYLAFALFLAGWTLMTVAMMLPTATTLVGGFARVVRRRPGHGWLIALVVAGFLVAWLAVGVVFRVADVGVHGLVTRAGWSEARPALLGAATLGLAGLYQFTPLEYRCLTACRAPRGFIYRHWHGRRPAREAWRIGLAYGASCVGCCWTLMLIMFVVGLASLPWMLGLAAVMAVEKNTAVGPRLRVPLGLALLAAGVALALTGAWPVHDHGHEGL